MQYPSIFKQGSRTWLSGDTRLFPKLLTERAHYLDATVGIVQRRMDAQESSKDYQDVMSHLLSAKDPETGEGLSLAEIWSESYLMINVGRITLSYSIV